MSVDPTVMRRDRESPTRKKGSDPMSTTEVPGRATADPSVVHVDMNLETVVIPVSDVDRAKAFYEGLGWRLDADLGAGEFRIIQFNPPASGCSIQFGSGLTSAAPGSAANLLVVSDIETAHDDLVAHGIDAEVFHDSTGGYNRFTQSVRAKGPDPERRTYASFSEFRDPDGNLWQLQEITSRLPGRIDANSATFTSADELARALKRAAAAHGEHETRTGKPDEDWPAWYAAFMLAEQTGALPPE
jgi:catechol 2,3-dioxygenase-like lactoylglutathione lyase family enzyme